MATRRSKLTVLEPPVAIMLDPGHGGDDGGCTAGGMIEKIKVLQLCLTARYHLNKDPTVRVGLTRDNDWKPTFRMRAATAKTQKSDLLVSLHINASTDNRAHGLWLFHKHNCSKSLSLCNAVATLAPGAFAGHVRIFDAHNSPETPGDDWLSRPEHVLERYTIPAILIEWGFATNKLDHAYLSSPACLTDFAQLCSGIVRAWRVIKAE